MKRIILCLLAFVLLVGMPINYAEAADVWVAHWNYENVDIYVVDESIRGDETNNGRYCKAYVKQVRDGQLLRTEEWTFSKWHTDFWRYQTNRMTRNTSAVIARNGLFEHCMEKMNWPFDIRNGYYY